MALEAEGVAFGLEFEAVDVVAVRTPNIVGVHLGLGEGTPDVDLVENLTIGVVEALLEDGRSEGVEESGAGVVIVAELPASRVAWGTQLHLSLRDEIPPVATTRP